MANDREILREIWEGKLPVCFKLDLDEINQLQEPDPFYLMVPRLSYFPLVTEKVSINALLKRNLRIFSFRLGNTF